jgi:hypothetical protein
MTRTNQIKKLNRINRDAPLPRQDRRMRGKEVSYGFVFSEEVDVWMGKKVKQ